GLSRHSPKQQGGVMGPACLDLQQALHEPGLHTGLHGWACVEFRIKNTTASSIYADLLKRYVMCRLVSISE
ncbi:hypothetical protein, partial [Klebsiella pneumoniae]|uniref:hypothetical protein n=1 Tax=Klebsiella pneumoniae TaxID=573 RepID=UPI0039C28333